MALPTVSWAGPPELQAAACCMASACAASTAVCTRLHHQTFRPYCAEDAEKQMGVCLASQHGGDSLCRGHGLHGG